MHVDLENVTSQIISVTEASRLEKLTPQSLDFWGIQCPEKTLIQSKLCQNSDLEESIMQQDNDRYDSAIYQASKKPLIGQLNVQNRQKSSSSQPLPRQGNSERSGVASKSQPSTAGGSTRAPLDYNDPGKDKGSRQKQICFC